MAAYLFPMLDEDSWSRVWVFPILDKDSKKKKKRLCSEWVLCYSVIRCVCRRFGAVLCTGFVYWWLVCLVFGAFLSLGDLVLCVVCVVRGAVCFVWCGRCGAFSRSWIKKKKKKKEKKEIKSKEAKLSKCPHFFWYLRYFLKLMPISIHNWLIFFAHR
jgi:hypothetical protein